jgi:hypothetical protein
MVHNGLCGINGSGATCDDKSFIAVDNSPTSPYYGRIYAGWTDFHRTSDLNVVSYSNDGGLNWSTPTPLPGSGLHGQGMWPAIAPTGSSSALVSPNACSGGLQNQLLYRSTNGGVNWIRMADIGSNQRCPENPADSAACGRQALSGRIRNLSSPQIVIQPDSSAPSGYVIHAVYPYDSDGAGPDHSNVFYRRSIDAGSTWSAEARLNDDATTTDQWLPAIGVNSAGQVVASWYDRRLDPVNNLLFDTLRGRLPGPRDDVGPERPSERHELAGLSEPPLTSTETVIAITETTTRWPWTHKERM